MPHWVGLTRDYNSKVRQVRALAMDAPRVVRSTTKDINVDGMTYNDIGDAARNESDAGFAISEKDGKLNLWRITCTVGSVYSEILQVVWSTR